MVRSFRRGEIVYKAGDPVTHVYLVQSGLATITVRRGESSIEVSQVGSSQILGEEALWDSVVWSATATANNDLRVLPIELDQAKQMLAGGSQLVKVYTRAVMEKLRAWNDIFLAVKLESDPTPCAPERIGKLFATIHTVAEYTGTKKGDAITVVWPAFKKYSQRTFLESPVRLEQATQILVKLGFARLEFIPCETDPDAPDELGFVHFTNLTAVKTFQEWYRERSFGGDEQGKKLSVADEEMCETLLREIEAWNANGKVVLDREGEGGNDANAAA